MAKKFLSCLILALLCGLNSAIFALDVQHFSGSSWIDDEIYQYLVKEKSPYTSVYDIVSFKLPEKNNSSAPEEWGYFGVSGLGGPAWIFSAAPISETSFQFTYSFDMDDVTNAGEAGDDGETCIVTVIDEDTLQLENSPYTNMTKLHRFGGHSVNNPDAVVNDSNVRIRQTPDTSGTIYGKLNTGDKIQIIDQSELKTADGKSNVWYRINAAGWPVCWIFGEYVTQNTQETYADVLSEREAFDAVPLKAGYGMTAKDSLSELFFDGTWCTESQFQNLKNEKLIYYGSGLHEKAKAVKDDACAISVIYNMQNNRIEPSTFTFHDITYNIISVEWENPDQCEFSCTNGFSASVTITDSETISVSAQGKTETWKRIASVFSFESNKVAKVTHDGTCIESDPETIKKETYINAGSIVTILEKGPQQKIGEWNDFWYRVDFSYCEINDFIYDNCDYTGWIYGAFLQNL